MGRINDLWRKIKGIFNKNKRLPEGRKDAIIPPLKSELKNEEQEVEMSSHEKFTKELQDLANEFNPNVMTKEDSIMRILEERGLSKAYGKHVAAKEQICALASTMLAKAGISRITPENLEEARQVLGLAGKGHEEGEYKFTHSEFVILDDGTLRVDEKVTDTYINKTTTDRSKLFTIKGEDLQITENVTTKTRGINNENLKAWATTQKTSNEFTYDKNGIMMKIAHEHEAFETVGNNGEAKFLLDEYSKYEIDRDSDLVTANVRVYRDALQSYPATTRVPLNLEHPEQLSVAHGIDISYKGLTNLEHNYSELASENVVARRETAIKQSPALRKKAEEMGLIQEESQELE